VHARINVTRLHFLTRFVAYYRVSTGRQGQSGLSLESQRADIRRYIEQVGGELIAEFSEVESGTRLKMKKWVKLQTALKIAEQEGATLIVAKLDRLARDAEFLMWLKSSEIEVKALDLPDFSSLTVGIFATVAQYESERISLRVKDSYRARRARGMTKFGAVNNLTREGATMGRANYSAKVKEHHAGAHSLAVMLRKEGLTYAQIASFLNEKGFRTLRKAAYSATHVFRMLQKYGAMLVL
jgi:DNA invertase Pin-like site-specific DNA recombinase